MKTTRAFEPADRYRYDFGLCSPKNGFAQVDTSQDAHYFGTWANPTKLAILCYCEGDVTLQEAGNVAEFAAELRKMKEWNEAHDHRFIGIDCGFNEEMANRFRAFGLADLLH